MSKDDGKVEFKLPPGLINLTMEFSRKPYEIKCEGIDDYNKTRTLLPIDGGGYYCLFSGHENCRECIDEKHYEKKKTGQ